MPKYYLYPSFILFFLAFSLPRFSHLQCYILFFFSFFLFLRAPPLHPQHMEVPRLQFELELSLPAYTTALE